MSRFFLDLRQVYLPEDTDLRHSVEATGDTGQFTSGLFGLSSGFLGNIAAPLATIQPHSRNSSNVSYEVCDDPLTVGLDDLSPGVEMNDFPEPVAGPSSGPLYVP